MSVRTLLRGPTFIKVAAKHVITRSYATKKTLLIINQNPDDLSTRRGRPKSERIYTVNNAAIDMNQLSTSTSKWELKHVGNIGISWSPSMDLPCAHPASYFGEKSLLIKPHAKMKDFLAPILAKKGPSGDEVDFRNLKYKITANILNFFVLDLVHIAQNPTDESYVRVMLNRLAMYLCLHDPLNNLVANPETWFTTEFHGAKTSSKPELLFSKIHPFQQSVLIHLLCSQAKPTVLDGSRQRGEGQVPGELAGAMLHNYVLGGKQVIPLVNIYTRGYYMRFISVAPPRSYVGALVSGTLSKVTDRPIFTVYPMYDKSKGDDRQGFNLLDAGDRAEAIATLLNLRHNIICTCPGVKKIFNK